jgi:hypothetical protein
VISEYEYRILAERMQIFQEIIEVVRADHVALVRCLHDVSAQQKHYGRIALVFIDIVFQKILYSDDPLEGYFTSDMGVAHVQECQPGTRMDPAGRKSVQVMMRQEMPRRIREVIRPGEYPVDGIFGFFRGKWEKQGFVASAPE